MSIMIEKTINEWLTDFSTLDSNDYQSYAHTINAKTDTIIALYTYLEDVTKFQNVICIVKVCDVLFKYYRSSVLELQRFMLKFLPQLLYTYLNAVATSDKKICRILETLLIGIYNLEVVNENGQPKVLSFRLPSLAQSSIYHEPMSLAPASLTESALKRLEKSDSQLVRWGPLQPVEKLIASNRLSIVSELLFCYSQQISNLSKCSMEKFCKVTLRMMTQGFSKPFSINDYRRNSISVSSDNMPSIVPRIPVSSKFLCQLIYCSYYALFNGFKYEATQAIEAIAMRASYHGLNDVILLTNAIRNCNYLLSTEQSENTPVGIGVSVSSTPVNSTTTTLTKSMITNASFRTKKLPDDIPIQDTQQKEATTENLCVISEEKGESNNTELHHRRSLPRMAANFSKRTKEKIVIAVKSGSVNSMKSISKTNSIFMNGGDETDESGIEMCGSEASSNLAGAIEADTSTPYNGRKANQSNTTTDIDITRSIQVSSV